MKCIESSGKTVKDAINNGVKELGCDPSDVEIEILEMGSPGLFGMFGKLAKVKLTLKESDDSFEIEMPTMSLDQPSQRKAAKKSKPAKAPEKSARPEKPARESAPEPANVAAESSEESSKPRKSKPRPRKENREPAAEIVPAPLEPEQPFVETPLEQLTPDARQALSFLNGLTERMGVPCEIKVCESTDHLRMQLFGQNMSILIGRRGETLDALQYLTSLNVNRGREEYLRVSLDTEGYRAKREEALRKLAVRMAGRARKTGKRIALEPMNPYERRILHSALQGNPDVTTHSEGEEPYRRVIITLK